MSILGWSLATPRQWKHRDLLRRAPRTNRLNVTGAEQSAVEDLPYPGTTEILALSCCAHRYRVGQTPSGPGGTSSPEGRKRGETRKSGRKEKPHLFGNPPLLVSNSPGASWKPLCPERTQSSVLAPGAASAAASPEACGRRCPPTTHGQHKQTGTCCNLCRKAHHPGRQNHH